MGFINHLITGGPHIVCPQKNPIPDDRPSGAFLVPRVVRRHLEISACLSSLRTNTSVELTKVSGLPSGNLTQLLKMAHS